MDKISRQAIMAAGMWLVVCIFMAVVPIFIPDGTDLFFRVIVSYVVWMSFVLGLMHGLWILEDYRKTIEKSESKSV